MCLAIEKVCEVIAPQLWNSPLLEVCHSRSLDILPKCCKAFQLESKAILFGGGGEAVL